MSEKLDGIRAYWDGKEFRSKNGNKIYAPSWFLDNLPPFELDGELWTKRDDFENIQTCFQLFLLKFDMYVVVFY